MKKLDKKDYARKYYIEHREDILTRARAIYKRKSNDKCKGCGADIKELRELNNGHIGYCNKCMADPTKTSRQARWYRRNSSRLKLLRKKKKH